MTFKGVRFPLPDIVDTTTVGTYSEKKNARKSKHHNKFEKFDNLVGSGDWELRTPCFSSFATVTRKVVITKL